MLCPVCGKDHIQASRDLVTRRYDHFSPCPDCTRVVRNKHAPPDTDPPRTCHCGKTFIDDVYVRLYHLLVSEGIFSGDEPLSAVGTPLIDPGTFLRSPPFLPPRSLLLISSFFDTASAARAYHEIPQISGILLKGETVPGIGDRMGDSLPVCFEQTLLCGCDVRADLFPTRSGMVAVYKKQGATHIEVPHGMDPKIRSVEAAIRRSHPSLFVDACSGAGTLGIAGGVMGVHHLLLNDPWYAAAYFSAFNLLVNKEALGLDECVFQTDFSHLSREKVHDEPLAVARGYGPEQSVEVYQGSMKYLPGLISDHPVLTVFDPFDKDRFIRNQRFISCWERSVGGEVFIP